MSFLMNVRSCLVIGAALAMPLGAHAGSFTLAKFNIGGGGGTDYITAEAGTGRVFVSRGTHVMVVDGRDGKVLGDIPGTVRNHGIALSPKSGHGFITDGGGSSVIMFDLKTLAVIRKIPVGTGGLDGIMHDDFKDRIILTNHSSPIGTMVALDARTGKIVGTVKLEDVAPEGAASNGKGKLFVNNERKSTIQVIDLKSMKAVASWPLAPCAGPTGLAIDRSSNRLLVGCSLHSVVVAADTGKIVATIDNGQVVDAMGWDQAQQLMYIPAGRDGSVTVVHEDSPDRYTVIDTLKGLSGVKTIGVDPVLHRAYGFAPEYGPAPAADANASPSPDAAGPGAGGPPPGAPPPDGPPPGVGPGGPGGPGGPPRGPVIAGWLYVISH